jgi:hypothetical protein
MPEKPEPEEAERAALIQALADALQAGASVTFTRSCASFMVTIECGEERFTGHGENADTALGIALAALSES